MEQILTFRILNYNENIMTIVREDTNEMYWVYNPIIKDGRLCGCEKIYKEGPLIEGNDIQAEVIINGTNNQS